MKTYSLFLGFFIALLWGRWCVESVGFVSTQSSLEVRHFLCVDLKRAWLWRKLRLGNRGWVDSSKPAWLIFCLLFLCGDVELNPGPVSQPSTSTSCVPRCCRCNRSGICKNCSCAKAGTSCVSCLPNDLGSCLNQPSSSIRQSRHVHSQLSSTLQSPPLVQTPLVSSGQPPLVALPALDSINAVRVPTLQHVPKGARDAWARVVGEALQGIISDPTDINVWKKWFLLPRCILANPVRGGRSHWGETLKTIRVRIKRWRAGEFFALWSEVLVVKDRQSRRRKPQKLSPDQLRRANARRACRAMEDGQYKKATQALISSGLAQASPEVFAEMLSKHPQDDLPPIPQDPVPPPVKINEVEVMKALRSFPSGTAPGPSALRANHLKEAVFCISPDRANTALRALTSVINLLCSGEVPSGVIPHLCGATLFASKEVCAAWVRYCAD